MRNYPSNNLRHLNAILGPISGFAIDKIFQNFGLAVLSGNFFEK
jgi:hypothetical protein